MLDATDAIPPRPKGRGLSRMMMNIVIIVFFSVFMLFSEKSYSNTVVVGEQCSYKPGYPKTVTRTGSLRTGTSNSPGSSSVTLYDIYSEYECKNTSMEDSCDTNPVSGIQTQATCTALLSNNQSICVQNQYKWVKTSSKTETVTDISTEPLASDWCGEHNELCHASWGGFCIKGASNTQCNRPFTPCSPEVDADETCSSQGDSCTSTMDSDASLCTNKQYKNTCSVGVATCLRYEEKDSCTGVVAPDYGVRSTLNDGDNGFGDVAAVSNLVNAIRDEMQVDAGNITVFKGKRLTCGDAVFAVFQNCCGSDAEKKWKCATDPLECIGMMAQCNMDEAELYKAKQKGLTTFVDGPTSIQGVPSVDGSCIYSTRRENRYCKWNSRISKAIQEGGRAQLNAMAAQGLASHVTGSGAFPKFYASGYWKKITDIVSDVGAKAWVWQDPETCDTKIKSYTECPISKDRYVLSCDLNDSGCAAYTTPSFHPWDNTIASTSPFLKITKIPSNSLFYTDIGGLLKLKLNCDDSLCSYDLHSWSHATLIGSTGWTFRYPYRPNRWNNGTGINGYYMEGFTWGQDDYIDRDNATVNMRYRANGGTTFNEVELKVGLDGSLSRTDGQNTTNGFVLSGNIYGFGSCNVKKNNCKVYFWSSKGVSARPFKVSSSYARIDYGLLGSVANKCVGTIRMDCNGFSLDELALIDMDKIDFSSSLIGLIEPITEEKKIELQQKAKASVATTNVAQDFKKAQPQFASQDMAWLDKAFCEEGPCTVQLSTIPYWHAMYAGMAERAPTKGVCYPTKVSIDWGDGNGYVNLNNPQPVITDIAHCDYMSLQAARIHATFTYGYGKHPIKIKVESTNPNDPGVHNGDMTVVVSQKLDPIENPSRYTKVSTQPND